MQWNSLRKEAEFSCGTMVDMYQTTLHGLLEGSRLVGHRRYWPIYQINLTAPRCLEIRNVMRLHYFSVSVVREHELQNELHVGISMSSAQENRALQDHFCWELFDHTHRLCHYQAFGTLRNSLASERYVDGRLQNVTEVSVERYWHGLTEGDSPTRQALQSQRSLPWYVAELYRQFKRNFLFRIA